MKTFLKFTFTTILTILALAVILELVFYKLPIQTRLENVIPRIPPVFGATNVFGYTTIGTTGAVALDNVIYGSLFTMNAEYGLASSITCALDKFSSTGTTWTVKCAIYRHSDLKLIGQTLESPITPTTSMAWYTFNFATSPGLSNGVQYVLVAWANNPTGTLQMAYLTGTSNQGHHISSTYTTNFPDPLPSPTHNAYQCSIYCTYTVSTSYKLNLRAKDWDQTDNIRNCIVTMNNGSDFNRATDANGWANYTAILPSSVTVKVKYFGKWVNGTFTQTMGADKTTNVRCKLYDVQVKVVESAKSAKLIGANVTCFNATSVSTNKITSGITNSSAYVRLLNVPNATLTFTQYARSTFTLVIGNTTQAVSYDEQAFTVTSNQNSLSTSQDRYIIAYPMHGIVLSIPSLSHLLTRCKKKIKRRKNHE